MKCGCGSDGLHEYKNLLKVKQTDKMKNKEVLIQIGKEAGSRDKKEKSNLAGIIVRELSTTNTHREIEGKRWRGRRSQIVDDIKKRKESCRQMKEDAEDRQKLRASNWYMFSDTFLIKKKNGLNSNQ